MNALKKCVRCSKCVNLCMWFICRLWHLENTRDEYRKKKWRGVRQGRKKKSHPGAFYYNKEWPQLHTHKIHRERERGVRYFWKPELATPFSLARFSIWKGQNSYVCVCFFSFKYIRKKWVTLILEREKGGRRDAERESCRVLNNKKSKVRESPYLLESYKNGDFFSFVFFSKEHLWKIRRVRKRERSQSSWNRSSKCTSRRTVVVLSKDNTEEVPDCWMALEVGSMLSWR